MHRIWMLGFAACTASPSEKQNTTTEDVESSEDSGRTPVTEDSGDTAASEVPDTTGTPDTSSPVDSAEPVDDTGRTDTVVEVHVSGVSSICASPDERATLGPMYLYEAEGDWLNQRSEENLWSRYAGQGLAVEDFNEDGWLDVFLPNATADQLFMGNADGTWSDQSETRLPVVDDKAAGATPVDVDDDGDVDIFVSIMNAPNRLLINDGSGHFNLSSALWLQEQTRLSQSSAWGDIDGDGDLDVFVSNYTNWSEDWLFTPPSAPTAPAMDALWLNQGDGEFLNADDRIEGLDAASAFTFTAGFWDRDDDSDLDLVVINDNRYEYSWAQPVQYFENTAGYFTSTGAALGLELPIQGMGLAAAELNGDGLIDFAIQANSTFLMYSHPEYPHFEVALSKGIFNQPGQQIGWGAELADMDNDGITDFAVAYGFLPPDEVSMEAMPNPIVTDYVDGIRVEQPNSLYLQDAEGSFSEVTMEWGLIDMGVSRGFVLADFNRDGFLDWMGRDLKGPTRLFLSRCDNRAWLSLHLVQPPPNRDAVGAKVTLFSGEQTWTRWVHRGSTNVASGGPTELHFGLNGTDVVDRVEIRWPDGEMSRIDSVSTRQRLVVERYGL